MKRWLAILVFIVALGAAIAWRVGARIAIGRRLAQQVQLRKAASSNVVVAVARSGDITKEAEFVGSVDTPFDEKLASKVAGVVESLEVRPGDRVSANQVLARINPTEQEAAVAQERSILAEDEQKYSQALLNQTPANTQVNTAIGQDRAQLAQAQANENQVTVNYQSQVAAAQAAVTDAKAKVASAEAQQAAAAQGVNSAAANYNDAAAKYAREYGLYKQGYVSAQEADDAYAQQQVQEAAVNSAKQTLDAAKSAVTSANAQLDGAKQQLAITKKQGQANIVAAKAATNTARGALTYSTSNRASIGAYAANLKALQAVVSADKSQLANLQAQVQDTVAKTPIAGTVTNRLIDPGSMAGAGQELLEVQFLDWLYVTVSAPVEYVNDIKPGVTADLTFDSLPGQTFHAPVALVTPSADPTSRQFVFQVKLDNATGIFKPGMFAHVTVPVGTTYAKVIVPREAVNSGATGTTVTVVDKDNVAHVTDVSTGATDAKDIEITSGVEPGDKVVVLSYRPVADGKKLTIGQTEGANGEPISAGSPSPTGRGKGKRTRS